LHFEKLLEIIYWAEKYETTSPHHNFFFSIYIKFLKKIHPFLICKSPYSNGFWYFYLTNLGGESDRITCKRKERLKSAKQRRNGINERDPGQVSPIPPGPLERPSLYHLVRPPPSPRPHGPSISPASSVSAPLSSVRSAPLRPRRIGFSASLRKTLISASRNRSFDFASPGVRSVNLVRPLTKL
jgi:hypothetical protein